nr:response regulator transcription factor [Glycomyces sambucus]
MDDQHLVRQGVKRLLDLSDAVEVVAEADDGMAALAAIGESRPDVVLLDLRMPRHDGIWTLHALRESGIEVPVLVLTTFDDDELALAAIRAGARGYLLKDVTLARLVSAVRELAAGRMMLRPAITDRMLRSLGAVPDASGSEPPPQPLTGRELDVLRLLAAGFSNREIAESLFLAEGTVKNHVSGVLLKLGTRDRTRAVLRALHHGLLD